MRYVAKTLRASLAQKSPKASEEELDKVPGGLRCRVGFPEPRGEGGGLAPDAPELPFPS